MIRHKMGKIIPVGDADALARAVIEIWDARPNQKINPDSIQEQYSPDTIAAQFEMLFNEI